ncbi:proteophosphoglycan ppg1 protein [Rutstroemia sp. NJR-2017a BVV2]|nr:proteophosphoglycan ppg1 protein [Rutstroemia sp. NJR-2017a BVV2]
MGRTSKFSFPIPGRKRSLSKDQAIPPARTPHTGLSKAEQILGTGSVVPGEWRRPSSRASGMSIAVSESTHSVKSINDNGSNHKQWDGESAVLPKHEMLGRKASSTILGQRFGEDMATETSSTLHRLRNEDSTSTLKSHYDRQKSPLAISQQTSASSSRDMALRKGLPAIVNRSPLLQVDATDPWDQAGQQLAMNDQGLADADRKKSGKLGLSSFFHRSGKKTPESEHVPGSSRLLGSEHRSIRNRLVKAPSKESLQSQTRSVHSTKSREHQRPGQSDDGLAQNPPSTHMRPIPESDSSEHIQIHLQAIGRSGDVRSGPMSPDQRRMEDMHSGTADREPLQWKNSRSDNKARISMISSNSSLGISSTASVSSHNTKTSRQTGQSVFSNADLQQSSVLSLSSDSEEDFSDVEPAKARDNMSIGKASHAESEIIPAALHHRLHPMPNVPRRPSALKNPTSKKAAPSSDLFLAVTDPALWPTPPSAKRDPTKVQDVKPAAKSRKVSTSSKKSSQQPTPPQSPKSAPIDADDAASTKTSASGRMMAVTKQEEALLEALRKKRARMRERIIEEHETGKSPPRAPQRSSSRFSKASSIDTIRPGTERVPLFLDPAIMNAPIMQSKDPNYDNGVPSTTDLSDFLSLASSDDSTPRNSKTPRSKFAEQKRSNGSDAVKSDCNVGRSRTPPPQKTLKITGVAVQEETKEGHKGHKKRSASIGVRFVGELQCVDQKDYILDESANSSSEGVWGL